MTTESQTKPGSEQSASGVLDELKQDTGRLKDSLGARAKDEAETRKGEAVQVAGSASAALNAAADDLQHNPDAPDWMASALQQAARQIDRLAGHVGGRNIDDLGHEVAQFARHNPGAFLAASAAAGFAAARVIRAGADKQRHDQPGQQQRGSHSAASGGQDGSAAGNAPNTFTTQGRSIDNDIEGVAP